MSRPVCAICGGWFTSSGPAKTSQAYPGLYHLRCEPTTCTCGQHRPRLDDTPDPDGLGQCRNCGRPVLLQAAEVAA